MSKTVRFKLSGRQLEMALQLSYDLKMPLDYTARQALYWAIEYFYPTDRKAYDPNYKENDETGAADNTGIDEGISGRQDVPGGSLENKD